MTCHRLQHEVRSNTTDIALNLYLYTADENYIVARWCSRHGASLDFIWSAIHALEKYMKCALLLNGRSVKRFGHDIDKGYRMLEGVAGRLLPDRLERPPRLHMDEWRDETPRKFLARLSQHGTAEVRYNIRGYVHRRADLYKLDMMVFYIRRLCVDLKRPVFEAPGAMCYRDLLAKNPEYVPPHLSAPLAKLKASDPHTSEKARAAFNNSAWFAPDDFEHEAERGGSSSAESVLNRRMAEDLKSDDENRQAVGVQVRAWFLKNNFAGHVLEKELCALGPPCARSPRRPDIWLVDRLIEVLGSLSRSLKAYRRWASG